MKNITSILSVFLFLSAMCFAVEPTPADAQANQAATPAKPACCLKAEKHGKTCEKPCCVAAAKEGKACEKCLKKKHKGEKGDKAEKAGKGVDKEGSAAKPATTTP